MLKNETENDTASKNVSGPKNWKKRILQVIYFIVFIIIFVPVSGLAYLSFTSPKPVIEGVVDGKLAQCPSSPNCVCSFDEDKKHMIEPIRFEGDSEKTFLKLQDEIGKLSRTKLISSDRNYLHYEFTSLIFRYVDDVEFLLNAEEKMIHVRSASRAGHSDLDVNRKRIEQIRALLK